jgi:predicted PurR-regulated permease PerM
LCLVIAGVAWYLLKELAPLLRPLCLAVFLFYVILPINMMRQTMPGLPFFVLLGVLTVLILVALWALLYTSVVSFYQDLPLMTKRAMDLSQQSRGYLVENLPWTEEFLGETSDLEVEGIRRLKDFVGSLVHFTTGFLIEGLEVAFYLFFLLLEAGRMPRRVRSGFPGEQGEQILNIFSRISAAMASYLKVKARASLLLAVLVGITLWAFGIKYVFLWMVLFFLSNFIPYFGSIAASLLVGLFAFFQQDTLWQPFVVTVLVFGLRTVVADLIEPAMTGKAINLSPLLILVALAFWGLCWGFTGLLLAVPLTVMLKIILENISFTKPYARLMAEE